MTASLVAISAATSFSLFVGIVAACIVGWVAFEIRTRPRKYVNLRPTRGRHQARTALVSRRRVGQDGGTTTYPKGDA